MQPADEDYARALLSIFQARNLRPRQSLPIADLEAAFLNGEMGRQTDFEAGLDCAADKGWLATGLDRIRLTEPGDEEMQTVWLGRIQGADATRGGPTGAQPNFWRGR